MALCRGILGSERSAYTVSQLLRETVLLLWLDGVSQSVVSERRGKKNEEEEKDPISTHQIQSVGEENERTYVRQDGQNLRKRPNSHQARTTRTGGKFYFLCLADHTTTSIII